METTLLVRSVLVVVVLVLRAVLVLTAHQEVMADLDLQQIYKLVAMKLMAAAEAAALLRAHQVLLVLGAPVGAAMVEKVVQEKPELSPQVAAVAAVEDHREHF